MKFIFSISIIFAFLVPVICKAQLNHFLYLQTEGKQPFYARIDKKILSSSATGYLIIPKLKEGNYNITIGFPKKEQGEQVFNCNIQNNDAGYLIKNFGDKGWGLFNLQTLDVVMAIDSKPGLVQADVEEKTDDFSNMLSDVVRDPSIKQSTKAVVRESEKPPVKQEEKAAVPNTPQKLIVKQQTLTTPEGVQTIYIDKSGDKQDTVIIFIPDETENFSNSSEGSTVGIVKEANIQKETKNEIKEPVGENNTAIVIPENRSSEPQVKNKKVKEEKNFLQIELKTPVSPDSSGQSSKSPAMINSDCKAYAAEEDFLKMRKKMASKDDEEDMISAAKSFFKTKCFSTEQIRNLSVLFRNEAAKYRFFDVAYAYVSDSHNFHTLEDQFKDPYFITRFKVMVRH